MAKAKIESTVELNNIAPALRSDLKFSLQQHGGTTCYLIEDEKNTKFFRIGLPEYTFISLLDGTTTIREAIAFTASRLGKDALSEHDAAAICKWLINSQLAYTGASREHDRLLESAQQAGRARLMQALNPLMIKVPLARPDRMLGKLARLTGWWFGKWGLAVWLGLMMVTAYQLLVHWPRAVADQSVIFVNGNWLRLLVTWGVLKIIHEASHGVSCKRFGGHVRESGLLWIVFAPVPYVDVTSAWRFPSKWQRIVVSAAGMYTELAAAALATLVWLHSEPGVLHQQAYNIVLTASVMTLLFNANPLMRFDGYYILSDWCEIPNLYALGQQYTRHLGREWFLGVPARLPKWSIGRGLMIKTYGLLAFCWRILVCAGLLVAASTLLAGAGIVLAIVAAVTWLAIPAWRFIPFLLHGDEGGRPNLTRFALASTLAIALAVIFGLLPEPGGVRAPAVVNYHPLHVIRAPFSGFVSQIVVQPGSEVSRGDTLLILENVELANEIDDMQLELQQVKHRGRSYRKDQDLPAMQVELELANVLKTQIRDRTEQLQRAILVAPAAGRIVTRDIGSLMGKYVREGDELLAIGDESAKQLEVAIPQADIEKFTAEAGKTVEVRLRAPTCPTFQCTLTGLQPRASQQLLHAALAAAHGGPLPVKAKSEEGGDDQFELTEPYFAAKVPLADEQARALFAGQLATVRLHAARGSLAACFYRGASDWLERHLRRRGA